MTPVWEEEWKTVDNGLAEDICIPATGQRIFASTVGGSTIDFERNTQRAVLAAAAPEMFRMLLESEYSHKLCDFDLDCYFCKDRPHSADCPLLAIKKALGVEP